MREVTLYRAVPERVLAGDAEEVKPLYMNENIYPVDGHVSLVATHELAPRDCSIYRLPHNQYVVVDPTLKQLVRGHKEWVRQAERQAEFDRKLRESVQVELRIYRYASLWQRIKAVFVGYGGLTK